MSKRSKRITLTMEEADVKKLTEKSRKFGISRNEFINRAVFESIFEWVQTLKSKKERLQILKNIIDKDDDLRYYKARYEAIKMLKELEWLGR